jgi:hypothetical protein
VCVGVCGCVCVCGIGTRSLKRDTCEKKKLKKAHALK